MVALSRRNVCAFLLVFALPLLIVENARAVPLKELRVAILVPFQYAEGAAPSNVLDEMDIEVDLPKLTLTYFDKSKVFKSAQLVSRGASVDADIYVEGEILHVDGGNGAARYFSMGFSGKGSMAVGVKVFDRDGGLIRESVVLQNGARSSIFSVFSNKKIINGAVRRLAPKIFEFVRTNDVSTKESLIGALESGDSVSIQAAAKEASARNLLGDKLVTDAMEVVLLNSLSGFDDSDDYMVDGLAWCAIGLGKSGDQKYKVTLKKVVVGIGNKKVVKHTKVALENLGG